MKRSLKKKTPHCIECEELGETCPECSDLVEVEPIARFPDTYREPMEELGYDKVKKSPEFGVEKVRSEDGIILKKLKKLPEFGVDEVRSEEGIILKKLKKLPEFGVEEVRSEDDIPITKITVTGKRGNASSIESGMGHLKYLRDQLAEETDEEEIANIKNDIKEWSSIMLEKHKSKPPTEEEEGEKKKKKVVSLMDLFNPSRPMGMR
jgi:hypothetical protein